MFKRLITFLCFFILAACHSEDKNTLKVGTISGPETDIMQVAKKVAHDKFGLNIKIIEFTDYLQPNAALNEGSLDANAFQHQPFLDQQVKSRHYDLISIGKTFVFPMGIYSKKIKDLKDLPNNAIIAIPNDPSNEGRALILLAKAGVVRLKKGASLFATPIDLQENPKKLKFKELDAGQLVRSLPDVSLAVINTNYAIPGGLSPVKDALFVEGVDSPYANIIVIRKNELDDLRIKQFIQAFHSEEVRKAAQQIFGDQAIPAW